MILRHDGRVWKINLRILWNHITENFQVKMVSVTASYYHKTFAFGGSKLLLDICLAHSRILYFWYILKSIHKFIIELHALQCLFFRGSNKKQRKSWIISNFIKGETFSSLMTTKYILLGVISECGTPSCTPQKKPSSPFQFGQEEDIPGHSVERRTYWFILKIARMFPILLSKNRMISSFIIVNITPSPQR